MCEWKYFTGSACAHRPEAAPNGLPRPVDERKFMQHGVWDIVLCRNYYAREANHGSALPCPVAPKPDYYRMTADMYNYGYELVTEGRFENGEPDYRCPRCRGTEPQSRSGRRAKRPRMPDWNAAR
ncbi:uncharacterized protein EKO05_0010874 [Ascochyta rabiei]|uniref:uncharacterized protein n=1 Tax=Didymella rabiei TaxID=5454 RepID=UPI0019005984|nr:uncharacterized protein EKO05_0010874 [Ascochyta rabiei]UPX20647.1 hypothetical protein EKO05_0010874 [Ascochyta rabiei]